MAESSAAFDPPVADRPRRIIWLWLVPATIAVGALAAIRPELALAAGAAATGIILVSLRDRTARLFLLSLAVALIGYAFAGRGFAYVGVAPLYVGEVALILGLIAMMAALPLPRVGFVQILILSFMAWGAIRTLPYIGEFGVDALRDGVVWGYAAFALLVSVMATPAGITTIIRLYARVLPLFIVWVPAFALLWQAGASYLPRLPGADIPIPYFKPGDFAVHLAGVAAFVLAGLTGAGPWRLRAQPLLWAIWLLGFVAISALSRGGMLAMLTVAALLLFVRSPSRWGGPILVGLLLLSVAGLTNVQVDLGTRRDVSVAQLLENVRSVIGESDDPGLADTREWREDWWDAIVDYTVHGQYFWQGKGFGINLAEDDGIPAPADGSLRAPHNAHLNILARTGIPGLLLWVAVQGAFGISLIRAGIVASRTKRALWLGVVGWIFVYWLAALVNMTFDVYLEGPQGGIFFWSLIGLGLAVASFIQDGRTQEFDGTDRPSVGVGDAGWQGEWARQARTGSA